MDKEEVLEIITMIADGIDPFGVKVPSKDPPEDNPVNMREVCKAIVSMLDSQARKEIASRCKTKNLFEITDSVNGTLSDYLREKEKWAIWAVLHDTDFDEQKAADILNIDLSKLGDKINQYGLGSLIFTKRFFTDRNKLGVNLDTFLERLEADIVREVLFKANFHKKNAANLLGITYRSLRYKVEIHGIENNPGEASANYMEHYQIESLNDFMKGLERGIIIEALQMTNAKKKLAAELLGITFRSLRHRIDQYRI